MTNKEKKEYLYRYRNLEKTYERLIVESYQWRLKAEKMTQTISDVPHGGNGEDQRELAICNMLDCAKEAAEKANEQMVIKREIEKAIESVNDDEMELLLTYRYIDNNTWEQVAVLLDRSWTHTHRLHAMALNQIKI